MSVEKIQRDITNLFNYPSDPNPTTQADYINAVKNWVETIVNLVDCNLWQPETEYSVGNYLRTPSLPSQVVLRCVTAGISGTEEPDYTDAEIGDTIADGSIEWTIQTMASLNELEAYFAEIIQRIENGEGVVDTMWETDLEGDIQPISAENVVPKVNGTGTLGTSLKKWANVYTNGLTVSGTATAENLSVSGTITGNVTGNVTGNADTATNATNDANGNKIDTTYLPLSGGTMTGHVLFTVDGNYHVVGNSSGNGSRIIFIDKDNVSEKGIFKILADDGTNTKYLVGTPNGTLTWNGSNVITAGTGVFTNAGVTIGAANPSRGLLSPNGNNCFRIAAELMGYSEAGANLQLYGKSATNNAGYFQVSARTDSSGLKTLEGTPSGSLKWNGQTVQTSSDKRLKQDFSAVPADVLEAWSKVEWKQFKYIADVKQKGDSCRFHTGLVAQDVQEVCGDKILQYGILCHDVQEATEDSEAVDLWTVRYTEALCMEVIYLRNEIKKLREEIKALRTE